MRNHWPPPSCHPGIKAIAGRLGLKLVGVPLDEDGIEAQAFADLRREHKPKALYLDPTLLNPTISTMPSSGGACQDGRRHVVGRR